MRVKVYVITDPEAIHYIEESDIDGFKALLEDDETLLIQEPIFFNSGAEAEAFCAGLSYGTDERGTPTRLPLYSPMRTDRPFIDAIETAFPHLSEDPEDAKYQYNPCVVYCLSHEDLYIPFVNDDVEKFAEALIKLKGNFVHKNKFESIGEANRYCCELSHGSYDIALCDYEPENAPFVELVEKYCNFEEEDDDD